MHLWFAPVFIQVCLSLGIKRKAGAFAREQSRHCPRNGNRPRSQIGVCSTTTVRFAWEGEHMGVESPEAGLHEISTGVAEGFTVKYP
jgi:hypothetical protein